MPPCSTCHSAEPSTRSEAQLEEARNVVTHLGEVPHHRKAVFFLLLPRPVNLSAKKVAQQEKFGMHVTVIKTLIRWVLQNVGP